MTKNCLQSLLHQHNLTPPAFEPFAPHHQIWRETLEQQLPPSERLRIEQDRALVAYLTTSIHTVGAVLACVSHQEPWKAQVPFLIQLPGIGLIGALTLLVAIGDITRFALAKHLVGYAGLGTLVQASEQVHRSGNITRTGRSDLRAILVKAAWTAIRASAWWRTRYEQLTTRMLAAEAMVAIVHKLLVVIWHVLTEHAADRLADPVAVARRLIRWGASHHLAKRGELRLLRAKSLDQIAVGYDLTHLAIKGSNYVMRASG